MAMRQASALVIRWQCAAWCVCVCVRAARRSLWLDVWYAGVALSDHCERVQTPAGCIGCTCYMFVWCWCIVEGVEWLSGRETGWPMHGLMQMWREEMVGVGRWVNGGGVGWSYCVERWFGAKGVREKVSL